MDSSHTSISKSRACPTARTAVSTWTRCDGRLLPRRANEGYTAELAAFARLVCQAYHRRPGRTAVRAPCASTPSLQMPAEQEVVSHVTECCPDKPRNVLAFRMSQGAVRALGMASRREPCMTALSCRKSGWIIAGAVEPHGIDDPHPYVRQRSYRHRMALAFGSLAPVVVQRPRFFQSRLPGKLVERIPQWLQARIAFVYFRVVATLEGDRSRSRQRLQAGCISIACAVLSDFGQQSRRKPLACTWKTAEDFVVFMAQKKSSNFLIILCDLLDQWQQLADQRQHQTRLSACRNDISDELRLMQQFDKLLCCLRRMGMMLFSQERFDLLCRSSHGRLRGGIPLQKHQGRRLVQFGEQGERHRIVRFEAGGQLIDQACLALDQPILIPRQQFELGYQRRIWLQLAQVRQITAAGLGQQIGIHRIRLDSSCIAATINGLGIDRIDGEASFQQGCDQQTMRRFHNTRKLIGLLGNGKQEALQLVNTFFRMQHTQRSHLLSTFIDDQRIMVGIGPINTGKPHRCPSLSSKKSLGKSGPYIQVLAARPSNRRWSQESCQGSTISLKRSSREEVKVFPRQFLTGQGVSLQARCRMGLVQL